MTRLEADWLNEVDQRAVMAMLWSAGHKAYFVGGCVRNTLLDQPVSDFDIATDAHPNTVTELARNAGHRTIPTGIDHGTVTVLVGASAFEITTFRRDVETDGRRAVVAFSDHVDEDAARRDFTMNALYAGPDGELLDPTGGLADIQDRRIRFIGDAYARIREDSLRILRFFRFQAWYGDPASGVDADALAAIAELGDLLDHLSSERVTSEIIKLLSAPDPAPAVASMSASGVLGRVLPGAAASVLAPMVHLEEVTATPVAWQRRLVALSLDPQSREKLSLSRKDAIVVDKLVQALSESDADHAIAYHLGEEIARDRILIWAASVSQILAKGFDEDIKRASKMVFPVVSADLIDRYGPTPALGKALRALEARWVQSEFTLTRDALLAIDRDAQD